MKILLLNKSFVLFFYFRQNKFNSNRHFLVLNALKNFKEAFHSINLHSNRIDSFDMKTLVTGCNTFFPLPHTRRRFLLLEEKRTPIINKVGERKKNWHINTARQSEKVADNNFIIKSLWHLKKVASHTATVCVQCLFLCPISEALLLD